MACGPRSSATRHDAAPAHGSGQRRALHPARRGEFRLLLPETIRRLLTVLAAELGPKITSRDPTAWRLFPPAHKDDPEGSAAYDELIGGQLTEARLDVLNLIGRTSTATRLSADEVEAWMRGLGMIRLVLAESPSRPGALAEHQAVLALLAELQNAAVEALEADEPEPPA